MNGIDFNSLSDEDLQALADDMDVQNTDEQLQQAGFLKSAEQQPTSEQTQEQQPNKLYQAADALGVERPKEGKQYKDSQWNLDTIGDVAKSTLVEASHVFAPKDNELQYEPQTRAGEAFKYGYRYMVGTAAMFLPTGWAGAAIKGASKLGVISKLPKAAQILTKTGSFLQGQENLVKGESIAAKVLNNGLKGVAPAMAADYTLYRPEDNEGHIADVFGETNNPIINLMQTNETDSDFQEKLKNVVDGIVTGFAVGNAMEYLGKPLFNSIKPIVSKSLMNLKNWVKAGSEAEATAAMKEVAKDEVVFDTMGDNMDMLSKVKAIYDTTLNTGDDPTELIVQQFKSEDIDEAKNILKVYQNGDNFHINEDGSYSIQVTKWEDASKVTKEEYLSQRNAVEKVSDMDAAVKSTMEQRKVVGTGDEHNLITYNKNGTRKGNTDTAKAIVEHYKDKWQIDNNIKVKFVNGIEGDLQGTTQTTEYLGKTAKSKQNAIDKKKLQISKLEDRITMEEGTNAPVADVLDNLKEELRIAKNELQDLEKPSKLNNHTILINVNTENPYAVLRSELEHIKNLSDGTIQKGEHIFPRYNNATTEDVMAGEYVYKKANRSKTIVNTEVTPNQTDMLQGSGTAIKESDGINTPKNNSNSLKTDSNMSNSEQMQIDFTNKLEIAKTPENITQGVKNGNINITTADDVSAVVDTIIKNDFDISGTKWENIAEDVDKFFKNNIFSNNPDIIKAVKSLIVNDDVEALDVLTRKVLALQKFSSNILEEIANFPKDGSDDVLLSLHSAIDAIKAYTKATGSGAGRLLEARKLINIGKETFGNNRISNMTSEGINTFSDMLENLIKDTYNTDFTVSEAFKEVYNNILKNADADIIKSLYDNPELSAQITDIITKAIATKDISAINKNIRLMIAKEFAKEQQELADRAVTKQGIFQTLSKNTVTYYITNLLSGFGTIFKNIASGVANITYTPALKVLAGSLGGGEALANEGIYTWKSMMQSSMEAWELTKQAWIKGEGNLSSFKDEANLDNIENLKLQFTSLDDENLTIGQKIWNYYSFMSRAMMASDEFLSQLNYRATARGKAYAYALEDLKAGRIAAEQIDDRAENILSSYYTKDGMPIDNDILYEAKQAVYQTNLDGSFVNPVTGEKVQMKNPSVVMKGMNSLNQFANSNPVAKLFLPFLRTGANILQMNLDHNLAYQAGSDLINTLSGKQKSLLLANTKEGAMSRARCAFGIGTLAMGMMMASSGMVTGSAPTDPKQRKALFEAGWRPYSININSNWVSYQGYEPIHTMLGFAADSYQAFTAYNNPDEQAPVKAFIAHMFPAIINNFIDKAAFRTGLRQLDALTNPDKADEALKALAQVPQGFLPESSLIRNVGSIGARDTTSPQSPYERIFNNYFNRGLGDYRRDVFGNRQDIFGMIITNSAKNMSNLVEYEELSRLGELGYNPSKITSTISDTKSKIKDFTDPKTGKSAYDAMGEELSTLTINGKTLQEAVNEKVQSEDYQNLPDGIGDEIKWGSLPYNTKVKELNAIFLEYNNQAEQNVLQDCGNFVNKNGETMDEVHERIQMEAINKSLEGNTSDAVDKIRSLN